MYSGGRFCRTSLKDIRKASLRFDVKVEVKVGLDHQATVPDVTNEPYEVDDLSEPVDDLTLLTREIMDKSLLLKTMFFPKSALTIACVTVLDWDLEQKQFVTSSLTAQPWKQSEFSRFKHIAAIAPSAHEFNCANWNYFDFRLFIREIRNF